MASTLHASEKRPGTISKALFANVAAWATLAVAVESTTEAMPGKGGLSLPVVEVVERYPPYADFCRRHPGECDLGGEVQLAYSPKLMRKLRRINISVNHGIEFALDAGQYGQEDYWALPVSGYGDCEDLALEKRARLANEGVPRGSLRLAFVFHKQHLSSHCILTVETSTGTYILDSFFDEVLPWNQGIYNFEARERTDGRWDRFDQSQWSYEY